MTKNQLFKKTKIGCPLLGRYMGEEFCRSFGPVNKIDRKECNAKNCAPFHFARKLVAQRDMSEE